MGRTVSQSIDKGSSVMLRLTIKTFYPPKPPLPLMHIDTTWKFKEWKFKEMIAFRDATVKRHWGCA
ncbi:MAG: phosphoadenosine phosphosulfate reductase family protein [Synergistaceae bacterium]|nr:phosphoadenosine phosphosulfate reductase family protein [Synergistaceae bacterium]